MKVVILAAGVGGRLGKKTQPKTLTLLANGQSILEQQLDNIKSHTPLGNVIVVVGFHQEAITEKFPTLHYVYNPGFAQENTSKSLLRALHAIDDDVLWLNGDVVFKHEILAEVLTQGKTKSCMVVNEGPVGDEEVKYTSDPDGKILHVSKNVENPKGEALGINYFRRGDVLILKESLDRCGPKDYFEKAIEMSIEQGVDVRTCLVGQNDCTEIDFPEDLLRANALLASWYKAKRV